jgi:hypothetical protein
MRSFLVWRRGKWGKWGEREEGMKESVARGGEGGGGVQVEGRRTEVGDELVQETARLEAWK